MHITKLIPHSIVILIFKWKYIFNDFIATVCFLYPFIFSIEASLDHHNLRRQKNIAIYCYDHHNSNQMSEAFNWITIPNAGISTYGILFSWNLYYEWSIEIYLLPTGFVWGKKIIEYDRFLQNGIDQTAAFNFNVTMFIINTYLIWYAFRIYVSLEWVLRLRDFFWYYWIIFLCDHWSWLRGA